MASGLVAADLSPDTSYEGVAGQWRVRNLAE
jgi:hypothetical protein